MNNYSTSFTIIIVVSTATYIQTANTGISHDTVELAIHEQPFLFLSFSLHIIGLSWMASGPSPGCIKGSQTRPPCVFSFPPFLSFFPPYDVLRLPHSPPCSRSRVTSTTLGLRDKKERKKRILLLESWLSFAVQRRQTGIPLKSWWKDKEKISSSRSWSNRPWDSRWCRPSALCRPLNE